MKLEIGKTYITNDGSHIRIERKRCDASVIGVFLSSSDCVHDVNDERWWENNGVYGCQDSPGHHSSIKSELPPLFPLVVGGVYRRRDGKKVIITTDQSRHAIGGWPFSGVTGDETKVRLGSATYTPEGRQAHDITEDSPSDIVAFWDEEKEKTKKNVWKKRNDTYPWGGYEMVTQ